MATPDETLVDEAWRLYPEQMAAAFIDQALAHKAECHLPDCDPIAGKFSEKHRRPRRSVHSPADIR